MTDDQRKDFPSRRRVEEIGAAVDWLAVRTNRVLIGIVIAMFVLAAGVGVVLKRQHRQATATDRTAQVSKRTADQLAAIVTQIQAERERNIRDACESQNKRHDDTVRKLIALTPPGRRQARDATISLIDALAPHRDCDELVASQVKGARP